MGRGRRYGDKSRLADPGLSEQIRPYPDGSTLSRITEVILPNLRIVADPTLTRTGPGDNVSRTLPLDETNTRIFTVIKWPEGEDFPWINGRPMYNGKFRYSGRLRFIPSNYLTRTGRIMEVNITYCVQ
ncbi:MAG: hypothetical protein E2O61_11845 [Gammaproteobacteria bacterium]|nr:MAG: hypothetical protein E2O59_00525 [Gammaproteobacteria bacterium]TDJ33800.1 MAG: hypothetical protein E2O61_11845 [Gammaproteobacteria bacterium]